jgi:histidyl-tRNA synthetase
LEPKILELIKLIGEEVVIFETFVELLNRQQEALVANDMDLLAKVTEEQERLALTTSQVEKRRSELVRVLSQELNRDQTDINIGELTKLVAEPESNQLRTLQSTLLGLHDQISTIKSRNDFLIRKSMEYINNTLTFLSAAGEKEPTYGADANKRAGRGRLAVVDRRI